MKTVLVFFIAFNSFLQSFSQELELSSKTLKRIFNENSKGIVFDWKKSEWSNENNEMHKSKHEFWWACNEDSAYFKADTFLMFNNSHLPTNMMCNKRVDWIVIDKSHIVFNKHSGIANRQEVNKRKIVLEDIDDKVSLVTIRNDGSKESFFIIDLYKGITPNEADSMYVMKLVRK